MTPLSTRVRINLDGVSSRLGAVLALVGVAVSGCYPSELEVSRGRPDYLCSIEVNLLALEGASGPTNFREVGSWHPIDCAKLQRNFDLALGLYEPSFVRVLPSQVSRVLIVESEHWNDGTREVAAEVMSTDIYLGRSTFALAHEFGHFYMAWKTGDPDPKHLQWESSGQFDRDREYFKRYERLP